MQTLCSVTLPSSVIPTQATRFIKIRLCTSLTSAYSLPLLDARPSEADLPSDSNTLVWGVVGRFKNLQLALPVRRAGLVTIAHEPLEVQYQDEFYQALHDFTHGSILVSPEFASASDASEAGHIDF